MLSNVGVRGIGRILMRSVTTLSFTLFMLVISYAAYSMSYVVAALFFFAVTALSALALFKRLTNEWIQEKYAGYSIKGTNGEGSAMGDRSLADND